VEIAATSACPHLVELRSAAAARPGTIVTLDQPDLAGFFARHDLQIGAGGGATWERCCLGVPTIALETAENQRQVLAPLCGLGLLEVAAPIATPDRPSLESALRTLLADPQRRKTLAARSRELVDGNGARRAAESLLGLRKIHFMP
jgi:spore coat polysaccharide biosynthesis predicted glycosyltransferase SpsG